MSSSHVGNGAKLFHLSLLLRRFKHHVAFCPVIRVHFEGSQLGAVYVALDQCLAALSSVFEDLVHLESFTVSLPVSRLLLLCVFEYYLFFVFLKLYGVSFGHACAVELGKAHVLLFIGKIRYSPLFFLLTPVWIIDDIVNLLLSHDHIENWAEFLDFFLLLSDGVKKLLFFILVFILNIFELLQIDYVFVLYFLETHLHLIHLFIQRFVIFLYAHQFLLSPLLL